MSTKHSKKVHLEAAASHHEQAARYHRGASRHFEVGHQDYVHAAHQAMMAHGHALHAIDEAHHAGAHSAGAQPTTAAAGSGANSEAAAKLHVAATELHEQAAQHMRHAAKLFDQDRSAVAHDAQLALSLALRALSHSNEAARLFIKLASVEGS
jgi:hypothetical protein